MKMIQFLIVAVCFSGGFAGAAEPVPMGSALRKELFDTIRPKAEELAEKPVKFAGSMRREGIWVYFIGQIVDSKGKEIPIGAAESAEALALWKKVGDEWRVVEFRAGFTDALFLDFPEKYGVPKALIEPEQAALPIEEELAGRSASRRDSPGKFFGKCGGAVTGS